MALYTTAPFMADRRRCCKSGQMWSAPLWRKRTKSPGLPIQISPCNHRLMGISNLAVGLVRKFGSWSGERITLEREIARINEAYATIDDKRARVERLSILINASKEIMAELDPEWKAESVKPSPPRQQKLPYEPGRVTRWAMDIIRGTTGSFSSRELAERIVSDQQGDMDDEDLINRVKEAVDASLRNKLGVYVRYTETRPTRWERIDLDMTRG